MDKTPRIIFIARDTGGCGFFRCRQPAAFLKRAGLADTEVFQNQVPNEKLLEADLVIMQELGTVNASNISKFCLENKIPFLTEIDDFLHHVSPNNIAGYGAWNPSTLFTYRAMEIVRVSMGLTVASNQLAREYFPYNPSIYVIPNYLNKDKWDNPLVRKVDGKIRIGWAGGNAHADDLLMISKVLDKIVKEYKGKVVFETMGMTKKELANVFPMQSFENVCPSCGYEGEIHHYPGESLENYPLILASKGWDFAVAPVINNAFGNCKSDLKIKEYSAIGLPVVASPVVPYKESGAKILLANTFQEWYNSIKELIEDPKKRDEISKQNKEWISKYWIQDNIKNIFEVYLQTIAKAELVWGPREKKTNQS